MTNFQALLDALCSSGVRFIIVGGAAATAHGASRLTLDLDIVYARDDAKRAAGRPKDFEAIAELESMLDDRDGA